MQNIANQFRYNLLQVLVLLALVATFVNIPFFYFFNEPFAYLLILIDLSYLALFFIVRNNYLKYNVSTNIIIWIMFVHMLSIPIMNGANTFVIAWLVLFPIVPFSLKSHRVGLFYSILFLVVFLLFFTLSLFHDSYNFTHIGMICMMCLVLISILFFILKALELKEKELTEFNSNLKNKIAQAVEEIKSREEIYKLTFEEVTVGIAHLGFDTRWININKNRTKILGYSKDELLELGNNGVTHTNNITKKKKNM